MLDIKKNTNFIVCSIRQEDKHSFLDTEMHGNSEVFAFLKSVLKIV